MRPPSRSEPSPNSLKADCEVGHKAATADSPTTSRRGTNDEASFTELQTSALGKLAKLAGVRAEETFAGASTAHMLEKAVDDAEENEHVRLQPPTPAPAYGGDYVASPAPERPDPIAAIGTDPSPESTSSYRYGPMSQGPTPPPPQSYPYGPLSASSSSSAYSPYSAYPYETTLQPQQPQQAYP